MSFELKNIKEICIEGGIGAGKTSLAGMLAHLLRYKLLIEPVADNPYLTTFYEDLAEGKCKETRSAIIMQFFLLSKRYIAHVSSRWTSLNEGTVSDRSIWGDTVFASLMHSDGHIDDRDYRTYLDLFRAMNGFLSYPDVIIYLKVTPEKALERITKNRKRDCEKEIPLEYLQKLDRYYDMFIDKMRNFSKILTLNWDDPCSPEDVIYQLMDIDKGVVDPLVYMEKRGIGR